MTRGRTPQKRHDGRGPADLRPVRFEADFIGSADGSVLIEAGRTRVICTASILDSAPPFADAKGMGWVTAEYGMLPASTGRRKSRPGLRPDGRGTEIRRIIGRALRAVCDLTALAGRTIVLDCDVIEADGGTRTASITGSYVALALALEKAGCDGRIEHADRVIADSVAAVSVGLVDGRALLDLDYPEDSGAEVDMNVAMTGRGRLIEVQATGETATFSRAQLDRLLALASRGCRSLAALQRKVLRKGAKR